MMKRFLLAMVLCVAFTARAQEARDTVIVELAKTSQVIFTIKDRSDLEILKHYDFQQLFEDVLRKLEKSDTTTLAASDSTKSQEEIAANKSDDSDDWWEQTDDDNKNRDDDDWDKDDWNSDRDWRDHFHGNRWGRTWQSFNFDLGTNNYLSDGKFPDSNNELYSVRPWGSWYVSASSIQRTRLGSKVFIEWGVGLSWYTFKFQDDNVKIIKGDSAIQFVEDMREVDFKKSKLSASYVHASLIPILDFGGHSRKARLWDGYNNSFRIGLGPYIGYRISSHSKLVYEDDDKEKEKEHDSFYLNNFRYGLRLQLGYRSTDLFFNYDLNELFAEGRGPKLNAFSFGVIF
jgi:hypothetical protein